MKFEHAVMANLVANLIAALIIWVLFQRGRTTQNG